METILKDTLGIIVLKLDVRDVLNLRATCKQLNTCILQYNKYWFLHYFLKNKFKILLDKRMLQHIHSIKKQMMNGETFLFPYTECLTKLSDEEVNERFFKDTNYDTWKIEANSLEFYNEGTDERQKFETAYCRLKYLENTEKSFICPYDSHYNLKSFSDIKPMIYINVIDEKILPCYQSSNEYFRFYLKSMASQSIIKRIRKNCRFHVHMSTLDDVEDIITEDFLRTKTDMFEEIDELRREIQEKELEIEKKKKDLRNEEEKSKQNAAEFLRLKEEYEKIFKE